jgi:hypothetical protein
MVQNKEWKRSIHDLTDPEPVPIRSHDLVQIPSLVDPHPTEASGPERNRDLSNRAHIDYICRSRNQRCFQTRNLQYA